MPSTKRNGIIGERTSNGYADKVIEIALIVLLLIESRTARAHQRFS